MGGKGGGLVRLHSCDMHFSSSRSVQGAMCGESWRRPHAYHSPLLRLWCKRLEAALSSFVEPRLVEPSVADLLSERCSVSKVGWNRNAGAKARAWSLLWVCKRFRLTQIVSGRPLCGQLAQDCQRPCIAVSTQAK